MVVANMQCPLKICFFGYSPPYNLTLCLLQVKIKCFQVKIFNLG